MHFSSKKKKTLQPGMSALNKAKECYRRPIFFAGFFGEQDSFPSLFSCIWKNLEVKENFIELLMRS